MKAAQSRQKIYADRRRRPLTFEVGDYVYLRVSPMNVFCEYALDCGFYLYIQRVPLTKVAGKRVR